MLQNVADVIRSKAFLLGMAAVGLTVSEPAQADGHLSWGDVGSECRGTQRVDWARLYGLQWPADPDWWGTCRTTQAQGVSARSNGKVPSSCRQGAANSIWAEWRYANHASCQPVYEWAGEQRYCNGAYESTVTARLWGIPDGVSWEDECAKTRASGRIATEFGAAGLPHRCEKGLVNEGIWGEWDNDDDPACAQANVARYPFKIHNRSNRTVYAVSLWLEEDSMPRTQQHTEIQPGDIVEFNIAGATACDPELEEMALDRINLGFDPAVGNTDSCHNQKFNIAYFDSAADFNAYAAEMVTVGVLTWLVTDLAISQIPSGAIPLPGAEELSEFATDRWFALRNESGQLRAWGVHGWTANVPQQSASVVYWGADLSQDVLLDSSDIDPAQLTDPASRGFVYELLASPTGALTQTERPCTSPILADVGFC